MRIGKGHPYYGKLDVKNLHPEVIRIWRSRNDELDELPTTLNDGFVSDDFLIEARSIINKIFEFRNFRENELYVLQKLIVEEFTLDEVGNYLNVTGERVRQIYNKARRRAIWNLKRIESSMQQQKDIYILKAKNDKNIRTAQTA